MQQKIDEHSEKLARIEVVLETVANNQGKMTESLQTMTGHLSKIELLMEKFANLETNTKNSIDRIHNRIDGNEANIAKKANKETIDNLSAKFKSLDIFVFIGKFPKVSMAIASMLYILAIKDIRDIIIGG